MPGKLRSIAVVVSDINQEYQSSVLSGAKHYAAEHGIRLCHFADMAAVTHSAAHDIGEYNIYRLIRFERFDGLLFLSNTVPSPETRQKIMNAARQAGIPVVVLDDKQPGASSVCIDNYGAMRQIAEHITDVHGCRRIFYISGPAANPESAERLRAVQDVLKERGLPLPPEMIWMGHFHSEDGTEAAAALLKAAWEQNQPLPEAIICANDIMAITAMNTLAANGVRIPEDVRVTGFDHSAEGRNFEPELTSVERPLFAAGERAMEMLCSGTATDGAAVMMQTSPFFAASCGCTGTSADPPAQFKRERFRQMEQIAADTHLCSRLSCSFAECETPEQMMDVLEQALPEISCDGFYFCLNSDWAGDPEALVTLEEAAPHEEFRTEGFPETMHLMLCRENGERRPTCDFPSAELLPALSSPATQGDSFYFFPLHFRSRSFGYCVLRNGTAALQSTSLFSFMMTLSNALEHVRKVRCTNAVVDRLEELYILDALTGIFNRNGFARETRAPYQLAIEQKRPVMVMFADLDGLKYINDHFGHPGGDSALRAIGQALREVCTHGEIFARFGGDEFLIFSVGASGADGDALAAAIQQALHDYNERMQQPFLVSASIGYHIEVPQPHTSVFQMVAAADAQMYEEKKKRTTSKYLRKY